ncbi:MAG: M20/M25/M40 family metallo-hydrolase, partial [Anaerolineae bacterium]|nr:M20/M25/M40 family metallo-hydrolase [Anaerolineae bacterium]
YEHHIRRLIQEEIAGLADETHVDPLGNLICRVGSGGTKIMVAAHMDEIGLMTTYVEPKTGYLRFSPIGGLNKTTLYGNRVRFEDGTIGVIGAHDPWNAQSELDSFYVDVSTGGDGSSAKAGCPAGFARDLEERGSRLIAKSMDDRIGCVVAIEAMRRLNKQTPNEVYFVFTVQEEVGLRGARPAAYGINPDVAVALDVTNTGDQIKASKMAVKLGGGAAIKVHDSGLVVPPAVRDWMINRAEADAIPHQLELLPGGGTTDAAGIQVARAGVPSGCISIPTRFIHTTSETVDVGDVQACVDLLTGLLKNPASL